MVVCKRCGEWTWCWGTDNDDEETDDSASQRSSVMEREKSGPNVEDSSPKEEQEDPHKSASKNLDIRSNDQPKDVQTAGAAPVERQTSAPVSAEPGSVFALKQSQLYEEIQRQKKSSYTGTIRLTVRRGEHLFSDSYNEFTRQDINQFKFCTLGIYFTDFGVDDLGGPRREWFSLLSQEFASPVRGLFIAPGEDKTRYYPNPDCCQTNADYLGHFRFAGMFVAKGIVEKCMLDLRFHRAFYKLILDQPVDFEDLKLVDPQYAKSLKWVLENDVSAVGETFSVDLNGVLVDLKQNGSNIGVTEDNKHEYVQLLTEFKLKRAIQTHLNAFLYGLHSIIPDYLLSGFTAKELEFLICGMQDYDVEDLKRNTEYVGYSETSPVIQWFWECVRQFTPEERARLLQFATGSRGAPPGGFANLVGGYGTPKKFMINRIYATDLRSLPSVYSCHNQVNLPEYQTREALKTKLSQAINMAYVGLAV